MHSLSKSLAWASIAGLAVGCGKLGHRDDAAKDAAAASVEPAATVSAAPVAPAFANAAEVKRYPDEKPLASTTATLHHADMRARTEVPQGAVVATLHDGQTVTEIAEHAGFVLVSFADPKGPSRTLVGWVAKSGFSAPAQKADASASGSAPSTPKPLPTQDVVIDVTGNCPDGFSRVHQNCFRKCAKSSDCHGEDSCSKGICIFEN